MARWLNLGELGWVNLDQVARVVERRGGGLELLTGLNGRESIEVAGEQAAKVRRALVEAGAPAEETEATHG